MEFTFARTEKDLKEIADMMGKIFRRKNWFEFYNQRMDYQTKSPFYKPEHSRIARDNGKIVGHVSIIEKYLSIDGAPVKTAGIGDVFTHPDARGKHVSSHLMNDAVEYMKNNDFPLSMLYGIPRFYHKFGYIEAMGSHKIFIPFKNAALIKSEREFRPCRNEDIPALNRIYLESNRNKTGFVHRVEKSWYNIAKPKELFVFTDNENKPEAYVIYKKVWGGGGYVSEVVAPSEELREAVLAFCIEKAKESFQCELEFRLAPDMPFSSYLLDFGGRVESMYYAEGEGNAMLRIIDLPLLLKTIEPILQKRFRQMIDTDKECALNIVTEKAGEASIIYKSGDVAVSAGKISGAHTFTTKQNLLVRSVIGYWGPERLISRTRKEGIDVDDQAAEIISNLFPPLNPVTSEPDYF